ncbi:spore coat U domain-containing protein [Mesorhizobium sp. SB112]|uniref:Csu type fimbrial protein n=1 Tax=Mesorhizobium sp. SB112 TaxID=3151853 RepID=UPI0032651931
MIRKIALATIPILFATLSASAQTCTFTVSTVNFGDVDTLSGTNVDTTGVVSTTCSNGLLTNLRVCLNINAGSGGASGSTRRMLGASNNVLEYNFYQNAARSILWGSREQTALGTPVFFDFLQLLLPATINRTIYARVPANQLSASPGLHTSSFAGTGVSFNYVNYGLLATPPPCSAVTQNTTRATFITQANVKANCKVTAQNINFGPHGVLDTAVDAPGGLSLSCTAGTSYSIGLNNGQTGTAPTQRRMTLGSEAVIYGLYKDANRSQPWGNSGGTLASGTGAGSAQNIPIYGRVPAQQTPSPGVYNDTVIVTVTY